jgi:carbonic anhydrase/acetyltransferase-like protein (isoleucine patch superfamily)
VPTFPFQDQVPRLGARVFLAPTAAVAGDVTLGDDVSFWFHAVARGDVHWIRIGERTNVQDGSVLHVTHQRHPLTVGAGVVVGHAAVLHGCTVEDGALIGIGARVLDGAVIEPGAQVGAGAVVTPGTRIPAHHLALGIPARVVRALSDGERAEIPAIAERYVRLKDAYRAALGDGTEASPVSPAAPALTGGERRR